MEGKGVTHAINTFRTKLNELWENKQMYICASLTTLADIGRHDKIITQLTQLKIDGKDLRVIKTMYWEQTAAMRVDGEISSFQNIKGDVRQCCVLSRYLSYEIIMQKLERHPGI